MFFTVLVILCLMLNSEVLRSVSQLINKEIPPLNFQTHTELRSLKELSIPACELSEKSLRVCMDQPNLNLVLLLLFFTPMLPIAFRQLSRMFDFPVLPKPRRIHLRFCRFQQ